MAFELFNIAQDLSKYLTALGKRQAMRSTIKGTDYSIEKYKHYARKMVEKIHPKTMKLEIVELVWETETTKTLRFRRVDGNVPPFRAGQYINLFLTIDGIRTSRPYSISSAPGRNYIDLTIRRKPDGFVSNYLLDNVNIGDVFYSSGPAGSFYFEPLTDKNEIVFIGGGSGITPIMSILRDFFGKNWPVKTHLIYGSGSIDDTIFAAELDTMSKNNLNLNYALVLTDPTQGYKGVIGFITSDLIKVHVGNVRNKTFLICGPTKMYDFVLGELTKLGVPRHKIRRELYGTPDKVSDDPAWPKDVRPTDKFEVFVNGESFLAKSTEPLLNSMEKNNIVVPALCRSGECSYCRTKMLSGEVFVPGHVGVRESDRNLGFIHPCMAYPISNLRLKL